MKENSPPTPPARYRACSELDSSREGNLKTVRAARAAKLRTADSEGRTQGSPLPCRSAAPSTPRTRSRYHGAARAARPVRSTGALAGLEVSHACFVQAWLGGLRGTPGILLNAVFVGGRLDNVVHGVVRGLVSQHACLESAPRLEPRGWFSGPIKSHFADERAFLS